MLLEESLVAPGLMVEASTAPIDETLLSRIERIVRCRTGGRIRDLRIDVTDDQVVISGVASTYYAKQLATHAALDEIRGRSLTNSIDVQ
jgi:hypothetical protein